MAFVTFGGCIASVRGRVGNGKDGTVYYEREGRSLCRSQAGSLPPATEAQRLARDIQRTLSATFSQFDRPRVEAWNALAVDMVRRDASGRTYRLSGLQAYQSVNAHRLLAGLDRVDDAPRHRLTPAADRLASATVDGQGGLLLVLEHVMGEGSGFWRIRLTPPLATPARQASATELRYATEDPAGSYVAISGSPQTVSLTPRWRYAPGQTLGVEVLSLSRDCVRGGTLFVRWIAAGEAGG